MTKATPDHDLLMRIDERQEAMVSQISAVSDKIDCMVPNDDAFKQLKKEHKDLWDTKNKIIGWMIGAGITGGGVATLLSGLVKNVLAYWK